MSSPSADPHAAPPPESLSSEGLSPAGHSPAGGKIGVLLVNLGTPDGTSYWPMRRYLKEFLSDRRVIETPRLIWWPILNLMVLTKRPGRKGRDYETIWNKERNEGPLITITRDQAEKLVARLGHTGGRVVVDWGMRYGNPSIAVRVARLKDAGCDRILVVPLYPQYAAATTATVCDKVFDALKTYRWQPTLRVAPPWYDEPFYIDALKRSVEAHLATLDWEPEMILASFHGIPKSYMDKGDPYRDQCATTARLLGEALGLDETRFRLTFQSRFGPEEWLQPYTDKTVEQLAKDGVRRLAIVNPGFTADCLETIEEIGVENAGIFRENGGTHFSAIPCLNASEPGMDVIEALVRRELMGWF